MITQEALECAARLCDPERRSQALQDIARDSGAVDALLLVQDEASEAMLPAAGMRQTLPRGAAWRKLLHALRTPGQFRGDVEGLHAVGTQVALAHASAGMALVLVGGKPHAGLIDALQPAWVLLSASLSCEQRNRALAGELRTARSEIRQHAAQAEILNETRLVLDETVRQLGEQARRAAEAGRAKDEFLAMLGHELRNPLSPIVTTLEVLRLRDAWRPELDVVQRQVKHMERLVEDLLDISRIARGKLSLAPVSLDLADVLSLASEATPEISRKHQQLHWQMPGDAMTVFGDRSRLVQVFSNLLGNASKYSHEHSEIRVEARVDNGKVRVSLHDQGIGLAPTQLEHVFEMFEQGGSAGAFSSGLGLGLAIVRNLVSHHRGRVWAESQGLGHGTSFHVELPLVDASFEASEPDPERLDPDADPVPVRVMLVDDNVDALTTLGWMLRLDGCEVLGVGSGPDALAQAPEFAPEVAVLDIGMPGMDGVTLAGLLRETLGAGAPQLVALTGFGQAADRARVLEAGFDAFLVKPVDPSELVRTIRRLKRKQAEKERRDTPV